jgi:ketosteroid isomerase-like protein
VCKMRTGQRRVALLAFIFALIGAGTAAGARAAEPPAQEEGVAQNVADQLLDADRRFAAEVAAARGAERADVWAGWFADNGRQIVPAAVVAGRAAIRDLMVSTFADTGFTLTWEPDLADGAGDRGWTSGRYVSTRRGADGTVSRQGRYLTIWRRAADGSWQVAVDTGVPDGD